ncbi:radical SAM family heme chaperone HemW [Litorivita sp. NS0012-18]
MTSVFFGGGTPSLMNPDSVAAIIERIKSHWPTANDFEITLEANPGSVEAGRFAAYAEGGVSRVSMGIQSLNNRDLQKLGRLHTAEEAYAAFDIARAHFDRISFDLIYARQDQTLSDWRSELSQALRLAVDHLSLYQLTIEEGTAFGDRYALGKLRGLPADSTAADMYKATQDICGEAGLSAYEVSNHAKDGAASRHNMIYWRYGDFIGIGPGAHGRLTAGGARYATSTVHNPAIWLAQAEDHHGEQARNIIAPLDQAGEYLMMGLRLTEGIDTERYAALAGQPLDAESLQHLDEIGMIEAQGTNLRTTREGRLVLNAILEKLLAG